MGIDTAIAVLSFVGGVVTAVIAGALAVLRYYSEARTKSYAAERDFQHLKRNQEQMQDLLLRVDSQNEKLSEDVRLMQRLMHVVITKLGDDSISGLLK
jgi:hypothetical protein